MLIADKKPGTSRAPDLIIGAHFLAISESRARKTGGGSLQSNPPGSMDYMDQQGTGMPLQHTFRDGGI